MTRLAVDFGARFADFVAWDDTGLRIVKQPMSGPAAEVLAAGLAALALDPAGLEEIRLVTTAPLNALLARRPARVALLTTRGFGDTLQLGRQNRVALYDPVARSPAPVFLVDPEDIHEAGGRLDARGAEVAPLSEADLAAAIAALRQRRVEAVALCFLFAHLNPDHELRAAEAIRAALPGIAISLSHRVDPAPREYERTVSVLLDAWVTATSGAEAAALDAALRAAGFAGELLYGDGRGVLVPAAATAMQHAVLLTGAPAVAARAAAALQRPAVTLAVDIGSQSADMSMARGGDPVAAEQGLIAGVPLRLPTVDLVSVPLGGACGLRRTDRGLRFDGTGAAPRLDDALSVLGRVPAVEGAAARLTAFAGAVPVEALSREIVAAAADLMALELTRYATRRNVDPTRAELVVMGGAGPLLAAEIAAAMGLTQVTLPRAPGASGAIGLAEAARRTEALERIDLPLRDLTDSALAARLDALEAAAPGAAPARYSFTLAPLRQMHPMALGLDRRPVSAAEVADTFAARYRAAYGIAPPGPGHLFQIAVHRDARAALPPLPTVAPVKASVNGSACGAVAAEGPALIATEAGAIWLPQGWHLETSDQAYLLQRSPS